MIRYIFAACQLILLPGLVKSSVYFLSPLLQFPAWFVILGFGTILGVVIDHLFLRRIPGWETFEHELTHALVALLFFRRVNRFRVTRHHGGFIEHQGGFGGILADDLIGLAPYFLPTFTFFSVLPAPLVPAQWSPWYELWCGFSLGFHICSTWRETKANWHSNFIRPAGYRTEILSDIGRRGYVFSFITILTFYLLSHVFILLVLDQGYRVVPEWLSLACRESMAMYGDMFDRLMSKL